MTLLTELLLAAVCASGWIVWFLHAVRIDDLRFQLYEERKLHSDCRQHLDTFRNSLAQLQEENQELFDHMAGKDNNG